MARPQDNINYLDVHTVPNNLKQRFEKNVDGTIKYAGHAKKGSSESDNVWTIQYLQYTDSNIDSIDIAYGSWTGRADLIYD